MEAIEAVRNAKNCSQVSIEATVDTGFENVALEECKEIFGPSTFAITGRGRLYFNIDFADYNKVLGMRSVDNLFLIGPLFSDLGIDSCTEIVEEQLKKESDFKIIEKFIESIQWNQFLNIWKQFVKFKGNMYPTEEEYLMAKSLKTKEAEETDSMEVLRFRATCYRSGNHSFTSMDAARVFGGKLQDIFHWVVNLTDFHLEVVLNIVKNQGFVGFALTKQSMHRRNITHFGFTTLRATVAFCLVHLAKPKTGDIVIDPLCGGGSIPIEGALAYPATYFLCGDLEKEATIRSLKNMQNLCTSEKFGLSTDVLRWNATNLPLRTASVDVFVTDLPFGKRSGLKRHNKALYHKVLLELARVIRPSVGRAVLLTYDKRSFEIVFSQTYNLWKQKENFGVNLGGLNARVFHLIRSSQSWTKL